MTDNPEQGLLLFLLNSSGIGQTHDDYSKPKDVRWLCALHHRQHHASQPDKGYHITPSSGKKAP